MAESNFPYSLRVDTIRQFSIIRFPNDPHALRALAIFAQEVATGDFFSFTQTPREISVIQDAKYPIHPRDLDQRTVEAIKVEEGFALIEVVPDVGEQIDFAVTGLLARLAGVLGELKIALFAVSTFDTDYILIRNAHVCDAVEGFREQGIRVTTQNG